MARVVLHIGMPKCGSSAIQTALTRAPEHRNREGKRVSYFALSRQGHLLAVKDQQERVARRPFGFLASHPFEDVEWMEGAREQARGVLETFGGTLILSYESWLTALRAIRASSLFAGPEIDCEAVAYIRPPVEWINSGWWQWGAWSGVGFDAWVRQGARRFVQMVDALESWREADFVRRLRVRLMGHDVVRDFFGILGLPDGGDVRINRGLPWQVLRFMQLHPELRDHPHRPHNDFIFARHLDFGTDARAPWVIDAAVAKTIVETTHGACRAARKLLDGASADAMARDPRWWEAGAYADREAEPPGPVEMGNAVLQEIALQALRGVAGLDERLRLSRSGKDGASG